MARRSQTPVLTGANYRQFAALVLVGALGVALFGGSDGGAEPAVEPVAQALDHPPPAPVSELSEETGEQASGEFFAAEAETGDFAPEEPESGDEEQPSAQLATSEADEPAPGTKPADTGTTPAQIARLIEASRERSGARPGGD